MKFIHLVFLSLFYSTISILGYRTTFIVHMDISLMPKPFISHTQWYTSTINSLKDSLSPDSLQPSLNSPSILHIFQNVLDGFSALLSNDELEDLKNSPGFVHAYPDRRVTLDTTHTSDFLSLSPNTGLLPASNYGSDVIVGVIDTGVWPESRSFRDDGMADIPAKWKGKCQDGQEFNSSFCNKKLIGVKYFNKGLLGVHPNITSLSMSSGRDTYGHGTHTSSTVAGNYVDGASFFGYASGKARGVAPRARVAVYKVVWDEGGYTSDIVAGIDQAVADGVDIISISLGLDGVALYEDPVAIASFDAMEKGVLVSSSAGNDGRIGSLHNGIPWVLTVAAGSIDRSFAGSLILGNGLTITGWTLFPGPANVTKLPLIYNKALSSCNSPEALSRVGQGIIICKDGSFYYQMANISQSNATAAIFISDNLHVSEYSTFTCPGVLIRSKDAQRLINYVTSVAKPSASIKFQQTLLGTKPAPVVASYSSRGPSPSYPDILKPDVMAPGTLVLASWIPNRPAAFIGSKLGLTSDFAFMSGTSMACPHASGVAALLKDAHPGWSPAAIRSAMMTTANHLDNSGNRIQDSLFNYTIATPLAMGAGQVEPNCALDPGLVYDVSPQDYVNLVCSMNLDRNYIRAIIRSKYKCPTNPSSDLNYPSFIALYSFKQRRETLTKIFRRTVTHVGSVTPATYKVKLEIPGNTTIDIKPKTLVFRKKNEKKSYSLTISYNAHNDFSFYRHGALTWMDDSGRYTVRSPIMVSPRLRI